jgi:hypothetical protein
VLEEVKRSKLSSGVAQTTVMAAAIAGFAMQQGGDAWRLFEMNLWLTTADAA